jgi:hypothetical protein
MICEHVVASVGLDEQPPAQRGGNNSARTDLQLTLISPEEQQQNIEEAEGTAQAEKPPAFSFALPQEAIDEELCRGSDFQEGKFRIFDSLEQEHTTKDHINFIKKEYGIGGHSDLGIGYAVDHDGKRLHFRKDYDSPQITLTWDKVLRRIGQLMRDDRYLNPKEKEIYPQ